MPAAPRATPTAKQPDASPQVGTRFAADDALAASVSLSAGAVVPLAAVEGAAMPDDGDAGDGAGDGTDSLLVDAAAALVLLLPVVGACVASTVLAVAVDAPAPAAAEPVSLPSL